MNPDFSDQITYSIPDLPRLYVITDPASARLGVGDVITTVEKSANAGARFFQFRDKLANFPELLSIGHALSNNLATTNSILLVNTHTQLAQALKCHGVHRPGHGQTIAGIRVILGDTAIIGASTHSLAEALQAEQAGATFVTISPIFKTPSKPGYGPTLGLDGLHLVTNSLTIPVYALGGITPENTRDCLDAGAYGIAVMGGIMAAIDTEKATQAYLQAIDGFDAIPH